MDFTDSKRPLAPEDLTNQNFDFATLAKEKVSAASQNSESSSVKNSSDWPDAEVGKD